MSCACFIRFTVAVMPSKYCAASRLKYVVLINCDDNDMLNWKRMSWGSDVNPTHVVETDTATQVTEHKSFATISLTSTVIAQCSARPLHRLLVLAGVTFRHVVCWEATADSWNVILTYGPSCPTWQIYNHGATWIRPRCYAKLFNRIVVSVSYNYTSYSRHFHCSHQKVINRLSLVIIAYFFCNLG